MILPRRRLLLCAQALIGLRKARGQLGLPTGIGQLYPHSTGGSVAVDAVSSGVVENGPGTGTSTLSNITVGASADALLLGLMFGDGTPSSITAVWDNGGTNQSMSQISGTLKTNASGATPNTSVFFGLSSPTPGNKSLLIAWTTLCVVNAFAISFTGAASFGNGTGATGASASASVTGTSASGNIAVGCFCDPDQTISSVNNTQLFIDNGSPGDIASAMNRAAGASSITLTATLAGSSIGWACSFVDVQA